MVMTAYFREPFHLLYCSYLSLLLKTNSPILYTHTHVHIIYDYFFQTKGSKWIFFGKPGNHTSAILRQMKKGSISKFPARL